MYFNPNIPPPNGFKFLNTDGVTIVGNDWERLRRAVIEYRRRTGGNVDTVWAEIVDQVCAASPGFCRSAGERASAEARVRENIKARVMKWLGETASRAQKGRLPKVTDAQAKDRARACVACRHRQQTDLGCTSCQNSVRNLRNYVLENKASVSNGLGGCEITGEDLASSIHLQQNPLPPDGLPEYCWRHRK